MDKTGFFRENLGGIWGLFGTNQGIFFGKKDKKFRDQ